MSWIVARRGRRDIVLRVLRGLCAIAAVLAPGHVVSGPARAEYGTPQPLLVEAGPVADGALMAVFLDRLMMAESGGRDVVRNPRSTALGPFQFIESTFLDVTRRYLAQDIAALPDAKLLALRTNREISRKAAEAFTRDNATVLASSDVPATMGNLRLAFLVGPSAAVRLLKVDPATPVITLLGKAVVQANPFMAGMTASDLAVWSERSIAGVGVKATIAPRPGGIAALGIPTTVISQPPPKPTIEVSCNLSLASCRRWLALAEKKPIRQAAIASGRRRGLR